MVTHDDDVQMLFMIGRAACKTNKRVQMRVYDGGTVMYAWNAKGKGILQGKDTVPDHW